MHELWFTLVTSWLVLLLALLALRAVRATRITDRILALDVLSFVFVATLSLMAIKRDLEGYLDVALMLALLAFIQTVSSSRYCLAGRVTP